ncbi:MAG: CDF family Co(II)/Ni(II) efflux transporter DmeF [Alphaproteobacteria bacterium]|nr:CDF family Co(II)/Ni(II) efflux transporter DmeF [Alphaproteobacteria bacterium]MBV9694399.1 CDF family Co(II)/Ni(II) efflux transporter DmeF [Alphaproteobacteria bacterium]
MAEQIHDHNAWTHGHLYLGAGHSEAERRTQIVVTATAIFMAVEIAAGVALRSMALLADGVHMATHVGALGLAAGAYVLARRHAENARFTFGSGKFGDLAAFTSAVVLGLIALGLLCESVYRLFEPVTIRFAQALPIAGVGLAVNLASALLLRTPHAHGHEGPHHDHNLRAAYIHVLADAATSVFAIIALAAGWFWGVRALDPIVGIVGATVIASWAYGLIRDCALVLLDAEDDPELAKDIRAMIEKEMNAQVSDLHLWRLGPGHRGLIVSLLSPDQLTAERIRSALRTRYANLSHVTVEVAICADCAP